MGVTSLPLRWGGLEELEPCLRAYLKRRCRDRSEVDDLLQETLLRAARYGGSLTDRQRVRGWATRIASNVLRDHIRRERRLRRAEVTDEGLNRLVAREHPPGESQVEHRLAVGSALYDSEDLIPHMTWALETLRAEDRRVLRSYYEGEQDCRATALECGIAPSLVKVRLFRARRRLARAVRRSVTQGPGSWVSSQPGVQTEPQEEPQDELRAGRELGTRGAVL